MQYRIYNGNIRGLCVTLLNAEPALRRKSEHPSSVKRLTPYFEETTNRPLYVVLEELYAEQEIRNPHKYSKIKDDLDRNIKLLEGEINKNC